MNFVRSSNGDVVTFGYSPNNQINFSRIPPPIPTLTELANLRLWVDANEGVYNVADFSINDATKRVIVSNAGIYYNGIYNTQYQKSSEIGLVIFSKNQETNNLWQLGRNTLDEGFIAEYTSTGDVQYPWQATWSNGIIVEAVTDVLATNNQGVEKWANKIAGSDYLRQENLSYDPTFKTDVFGLSALLFNGNALYADNISDTNFDREFSLYIVSTPLNDNTNDPFGAVISIGNNLRFGVGDGTTNPILLVQNIIDPYSSNLLTYTIDNKFGVFSARGNLNEANPIIKISKNLETEEIVPNFAYSINSKSIKIGASDNSASSRSINSNIAEILVYQDYHDDVKAQNVINYLIQKHNINTNPPTFAPDSLPELQLWADAGQGVLNFVGNNFTDETATIVTAGFSLFGDGVDPNTTFGVGSKLNNRNTYSAGLVGGDNGGSGSIYWDGSQWVFQQIDNGEEGSDTYYLYATGDTQYPWNANWGGGRSITRTPTTTDIVATNGMTVERWLNKVGNRSINSASNSNNRPTYTVDGNGRPALYFDGNDFMSGGVQSIFNRQYSYYFVSSNLSALSSNLAVAVGVGSANRGNFGVNATNIGASNGTAQYSSFGAGEPAITNRKVYSARFINTAGQPIIGLNKTYETLIGSIGTSNAVSNTVRIGAGSSAGASAIYGYFSEILVYRAFHSVEIANKIVDYLNAKWGIT